MTTRPTERIETAPHNVIERLVALACLAPSVHNTQPWLWQYDDERLTLRADRSRWLPAEDPQGRNLILSCGAVLHHLQFAARALGWTTTLDLFPEPGDDSVLAHVVVERHEPLSVEPADIALLRERCTDRRRFTAWPVPADRLESLRLAAARWGVQAQAITDDAARFRLELLANRALTDLELDDLQLDEQARWIDRLDPDGIPGELLPFDPDPLQARSRFQPRLLEDTRMVIYAGDRVIAFGSTADDPIGWLRTGQAMSSAWLEATRQGLSVVPMTRPIEDEDTRDEIARDVLGNAFLPHVLLRVGWQAMGRRELPRTPRRPVSEVLRHQPR